LYGLKSLDEEIRVALENSLILELKQAGDALDLIDVDEERCGRELLPLLYHMLKTALPYKTHEILFSCQGACNKKVRTQHDQPL
jgi:transposase